MHFPKTYLTNLILKCYPEKHPHLTLTSKHTLPKRSPRIFAPKHIPDERPRLTPSSKHTLSKRTSRNLTRTLSRKTHPPNPYPKTHLPKTYLTNLNPKHTLSKRTHLNLDKEGNRRVRAPELFREFRAASIFAHPTLGRGDLSVVCGVPEMGRGLRTEAREGCLT